MGALISILISFLAHWLRPVSEMPNVAFNEGSNIFWQISSFFIFECNVWPWIWYSGLEDIIWLILDGAAEQELEILARKKISVFFYFADTIHDLCLPTTFFSNQTSLGNVWLQTTVGTLKAMLKTLKMFWHLHSTRLFLSIFYFRPHIGIHAPNQSQSFSIIFPQKFT